jgi:DNA-binding MarR family transcriptional regulator
MTGTRDAKNTECAARLRAAVSRLARGMRESAAGQQPAAAKLSALSQLRRHGPMTPSMLATRERVKLQSLTRLLAELEGEALIIREAHPLDGRQSIISITERGVRLLADAAKSRQGVLQLALSSCLTDAELEQLQLACTLLERIGDRLESHSVTHDAPAPRSATGSSMERA